MNRDRCYSGQEDRSRPYDTEEARVGYWRVFERQKGVPCPRCSGTAHAPGCPESEYEIARRP